MQAGDHQAILVGPLIARPVDLAVCGSVCSCWIIGFGENELLVGQLTEYQLWWLTQRRLLLAFLAAAGLLASVSFGWTCLGVKDAIFLAAIEELVDV
jgi:hypothetical protein